MADYEYIGIAYFSENGADISRKIFHECKKNHVGPFQEASSLEKASFTDFIQEIIDRGFKANILDIHKGWLEVHDKDDVEVAERIL